MQEDRVSNARDGNPCEFVSVQECVSGKRAETNISKGRACIRVSRRVPDTPRGDANALSLVLAKSHIHDIFVPLDTEF